MSDAYRRSAAFGLSNRKQNRARKRLMVRYGEETPDQTAFTQNLSEGGMYVKTNDVLPPGTELTLEIQTEEGTFVLQGCNRLGKTGPRESRPSASCRYGNSAHTTAPGVD